MKIIIATLVTALGMVVLPQKAEARPHGHCGTGYTYRSGHASCGCSIYTKRIIIGYDHCRRPIYRYHSVPVVHRCHKKYGNYHHRKGYYGHHGYGGYGGSYKYGHRYRGYGNHISLRTHFGGFSVCR